jgi:hypothetical protein
MKEQRVLRALFCALAIASFSLAVAGCGSNHLSLPSSASTSSFSLQGHAFGGQQPIAGATIHLYIASTAGYGAAATSAYPYSTKTDASGGFNITNEYTCPANAMVYLTATGGNPGLGSINNNIAEMAALGPCSNLTSATNIEMNELTTVASVYALSAFMKGPANLGTSATNGAGLALAFADVNELVNTSTGALPGPSLPTGSILPTATMNTLADILGACINSAGGTAGDKSPCGNLFAATTPPGGTSPTDTVTAALNIAQNPALNVSTLFGLLPSQLPFMPQLPSAPNDWMLAVTYAPGTLSSPSAIAIDAYGNAWITNRAGSSVSELTHTGALASGSSYSGALSSASALALDASGNPWVAEAGNNSVVYLTSTTGSPVASGTGGLNAPSAAAIDAQGNIWLANSGASTVTELNSTGTPLAPGGFSGPGIVKPLGIAISPH